MAKKVYNVRVRKLIWAEQKSLERAVELRKEIKSALIVLIRDPYNLMDNTMSMIKKLERQISAMEYELNCRKRKGERENEQGRAANHVKRNTDQESEEGKKSNGEF